MSGISKIFRDSDHRQNAVEFLEGIEVYFHGSLGLLSVGGRAGCEFFTMCMGQAIIVRGLETQRELELQV